MLKIIVKFFYLILVLVFFSFFSVGFGESVFIKNQLEESYQLVNDGKFGEALEIVEQILKQDNQNIDALSLQGAIFLKMDENERALEIFQNVLDREPDNVDVLSNTGVVLGLLERYDEAEKYLKKALEINPNHVNALSNMGALLTKEERYDEAIVYLDKALEINPSLRDPLKNKLLIMDSLDLVQLDGFAQTILRDKENKLIGYFETDRIFISGYNKTKSLIEELSGIRNIRTVTLDGKNFQLIEIYSKENVETNKLVSRVALPLTEFRPYELIFDGVHARHHGFPVHEGDSIETFWELIFPE